MVQRCKEVEPKPKPSLPNPNKYNPICLYPDPILTLIYQGWIDDATMM